MRHLFSLPLLKIAQPPARMGPRFQGNGLHSQLYICVEEEVWKIGMEGVITVLQAGLKTPPMNTNVEFLLD